MQAYHIIDRRIDIYVQSDTVELIQHNKEKCYRIVEGYAEKSTCKYLIKTLQCVRRKEPVFILLCSYRSMERSCHALAYSLEVALAVTINGLGGIEKGMEQSEERKSGWTPCLEK